MNFDKINFVLNVLSSDTIIANEQNLIKLFVVDSIAETEISNVSFRLLERDGRNTSNTIVDWTELTLNKTFYELTYTPTFSKNTKLLLQVKVLDLDSSVYLLESNLEGVI